MCKKNRLKFEELSKVVKADYCIERYYRIFDTAYKNEADAKKIEVEWSNYSQSRPIYLIVYFDEKRESISLLEKEFDYSESLDEIENLYTSEYARKCAECGCYFDDGFLVNDYDTYCSKKCMFEVEFANEEEYLEAYENNEAFWTTFGI